MKSNHKKVEFSLQDMLENNDKTIDLKLYCFNCITKGEEFEIQTSFKNMYTVQICSVITLLSFTSWWTVRLNTGCNFFHVAINPKAENINN